MCNLATKSIMGALFTNDTVEAVKLTGSTSKEESRDIFSRLTYSAGGRSKSAMSGSSGPEIKLCYVTVCFGFTSHSFDSNIDFF